LPGIRFSERQASPLDGPSVLRDLDVVDVIEFG
jgi:hypothetical protein